MCPQAWISCMDWSPLKLRLKSNPFREWPKNEPNAIFTFYFIWLWRGFIDFVAPNSQGKILIPFTTECFGKGVPLEDEGGGKGLLWCSLYWGYKLLGPGAWVAVSSYFLTLSSLWMSSALQFFLPSLFLCSLKVLTNDCNSRTTKSHMLCSLIRFKLLPVPSCSTSYQSKKLFGGLCVFIGCSGKVSRLEARLSLSVPIRSNFPSSLPSNS